jgi:DNA-binding Xre family transcriptional regulator
MESKKATSYTLRFKGDLYNIDSSTMRRLKAGESVSTNTIDSLCKSLDCGILDIIEYIPD